MATVNFSIPDEVKNIFNEAFEGKNRSAVIANLMREAAEHELALRRRREAVAEVLQERADLPPVAVEKVREALRGTEAMKPTVVVDASVSVKWFVPQLPEEDDVPAALAMLRAYAEDRITLYQPPLWRAEVLAVLARVSPEAAARHAWRFLSFDHEIADSPAVYLKAVEMAIELGHHLFDTMYHAAALTHPNAVLITADNRYRAKGEPMGRILPLPLWESIFEL